jgi:uncharacterized membrane protein YbhN (UPF0104 family)
MWKHLRRWWPVGKVLMAGAILTAIGWYFRRELQDPVLWNWSFQPGWLVVSGVLYSLGLGVSACYWYRLLRRIGQHPHVPAVVRAYYVGQLGKYVPGKAWAVLVRATLAGGAGVRPGLAGLTAFYEVLTTMTAGVLLAAVLLALLQPDTTSGIDWSTFERLVQRAPDLPPLDRKTGVLLAVLMLVPVGVSVLPPIFNRLAYRLSLPFREKDAAPLPRMQALGLLEGLLMTACGWLLLGASVWAGLQAASPQPLPWTMAVWGRLTAFLAMAYVAGFLAIFLPGGIGVREFFLIFFLTAELTHLVQLEEEMARLTVVAAVGVLRFVWFVADIVVAAIVYWLPRQRDMALVAP